MLLIAGPEGPTLLIKLNHAPFLSNGFDEQFKCHIPENIEDGKCY